MSVWRGRCVVVRNHRGQNHLILIKSLSSECIIIIMARLCYAFLYWCFVIVRLRVLSKLWSSLYQPSPIIVPSVSNYFISDSHLAPPFKGFHIRVSYTLLIRHAILRPKIRVNRQYTCNGLKACMNTLYGVRHAGLYIISPPPVADALTSKVENDVMPPIRSVKRFSGRE